MVAVCDHIIFTMHVLMLCFYKHLSNITATFYRKNNTFSVFLKLLVKTLCLMRSRRKKKGLAALGHSCESFKVFIEKYIVTVYFDIFMSDTEMYQ